MALFRKRDFAVIAAIIISAYVTLDNRSFSYLLEPAWYVDQRGAKSNFSGRPIIPIITDLDGNGQKEIILITKNFELKVNIISSNIALYYDF